jgi:hypothetical protein
MSFMFHSRPFMRFQLSNVVFRSFDLQPLFLQRLASFVHGRPSCACIKPYIKAPLICVKPCIVYIRESQCKGYQTKKSKKSKAHMAEMLQAETLPNRKPQHLAFKSQPLSFTLAARTRAAPSKAEVEAQTCGAI